MRMRSWAVALVVTCGSAACQPGESAPVQDTVSTAAPDADSAAIAQITAELDAAYSSEDFRAAARHFSDDIVHLPPNEPAVIGRAAVTARDSVFGVAYDDTLTSAIEDLRIRGDQATVRLQYTESWAPRDGGERTTVDGKTLLVLHKGPGGTWQITHYMWNDNGPRR